ncbi:MAG: caspase family protein, partial [Saprospiraceae bacterium]|nr:caspase family protein [Saprospiraceae bacterium]
MKKAYLPIFAALFCLAVASSSEHALPRRGKDFALFIAVNNYQNWGKLQHPIREVEKIAGELYRQYDFDTLVLRNPTQDQIVTALRKYNAQKYPDDGQLLIYLSGHGDFDDLTKEGFFIPREGKRNDQNQTSYLSFSRLQRIVENIPCQHIVLAIDACYSGTFDRLVALKGDKEPNFGRPFNTGDERSRLIERELTLQSRFFVASGKKEQTPDASNFAAYFLRALRNGGRDYNLLSMHELVAELKKAQPKPHISTFSGHQEDANFLFIKNLSSIPAPAIHDARRDLSDWQEAVRLNTAAAFRAYLLKQERGEFRNLAENLASALEAEEREITAWNTAKAQNTCEGYKKFIRDFPNSPYRPLADEAEKRTCKPGFSLPAPIQKLETNMARITGGSFTMGSKDTTRVGDCADAEKPPHEVRVRDFYISRYEVTQAQWRAVMGSDPPELHNKGCDECPVEG